MAQSAFITSLRPYLTENLSARWDLEGGESTLSAVHRLATELICKGKFNAQLWVVPQKSGSIRCAFEIQGNEKEKLRRESIAAVVRGFANDVFAVEGVLTSEGSTVAHLALRTNDLETTESIDRDDLDLVARFCNLMDKSLMDWMQKRLRVEDDTAGRTDSSLTLSPRQPDPLVRCKVEEAAINETIAGFENDDYLVYSQEKDNVGWDLVATRGDRQLHLEVKGLSGSVLCVELTPNEYAQMLARRNSYRVCVVTTALTNPQLAIFSYRPESNTWQDDQKRTLRIKELTAARCQVV